MRLSDCADAQTGLDSISCSHTTKSKRVWSESAAITHCRPTHSTVRKSHRTLAVTRQKQSNQLSLPCQYVCKTQKGHKSNAYQNKD